MKNFRSIVLTLVLLMTCGEAFAQQTAAKPGNSRKYRTILTAAGAGGGFVLGVFGGIAMFDDAINSDRKVWTTAIVSAGAGGVGGFLIGRSMDKRRNRASLQGIQVAPMLTSNVKGLQVSFVY